VESVVWQDPQELVAPAEGPPSEAMVALVALAVPVV